MATALIPVPALSDNYVWLLHDDASGETVAVDPGEAPPVLAAVEARGWRITQVWNTHWHSDHVGGNADIKAATGAVITGPYEEGRIPTLDRVIGEGDTVRIGAHEGVAIAVGAHTSGHIAIHMPGLEIVFTGDTLFAMGCGRLFEGSAADMFAAMRKLAALPPETRVACGHEYTVANGRYAVAAEPDNGEAKQALADAEVLRAKGVPTLPSTIGAERATNPFMRAASPEQLAERRAAKDVFK
ncbi:hydroxyacylglutathione hydrolase [Sphingomonas sp. CGMCC 1.13654]|uniref:Hydroxyacylglutathione hydrolase n=1 Tax=Sphingomonas chungangi TaxID=2683589 RepID=A0A838L271_9SPHN|nr:hydroxyacylglutathione hydrolase [Sphingomonas chungangi]MBA2932622.1 hydroxyacylglutathione hydrolase [Sphingomonas chungangi]MVW56245.1 hydroxyacylglutathione hydrolase [Sphingomonas chungangi]